MHTSTSIVVKQRRLIVAMIRSDDPMISNVEHTTVISNVGVGKASPGFGAWSAIQLCYATRLQYDVRMVDGIVVPL